MIGCALKGAALRRALIADAPFRELLQLGAEMVSACFTSVGFLLRSAGLPLQARTLGASERRVFPLPFTAHGRRRRGEPSLVKLLVDVWVAFLNVAYLGPGAQACLSTPTAAQQRVLQSLGDRAARLLSDVGHYRVGGEPRIRELLRMDATGYGDQGPVLPLGLRCSLPARAATVDTAAVLSESFPLLSQQCSDPSLLLRSDFEEPPGRPFSLLASSYPQYVEKGVSSGYYVMADASDLHEVNGVPIVGGGFAVRKDQQEDRPISLLESLTPWWMMLSFGTFTLTSLSSPR